MLSSEYKMPIDIVYTRSEYCKLQNLKCKLSDWGDKELDSVYLIIPGLVISKPCLQVTKYLAKYSMCLMNLGKHNIHLL